MKGTFDDIFRWREFALLGIIAGCLLLLVYWEEFRNLAYTLCYSFEGGGICENSVIRSAVGGTLWGAAFLPIVLYTQYWLPAKDQPLISAGFLQDFIWYLLLRFYKVFVLVWFSALLYTFYDNHLPFLRSQWIHDAPIAVQVVLVLLLVDLLAWIRHLLHHKIPILWEFHKFHHSQRQMNFFCEIRVHPVESISARLIEFIPFYSLGLDIALPTYAALEIARRWQGHLVHSNVRGTFGWLRFIFVNPQSHRIHHSNEIRHQDKNYATVFSFWDFLFRTQYLKFDEYPDTGVDDPDYPYEEKLSIPAFARSTLSQFIYPFITASHMLKSKLVRAPGG